MPASLHPYLIFDGTAREVFDAYGKALGGTPVYTTFGEAGAVPADHPQKERIMHGALEVTDLIKLYVSDALEGMGDGPIVIGNTFSLALMGDDEERLREAFTNLSEGGTVRMPLQEQMWGDVYGQLVDRFGIEWQVNISSADGDDPDPVD